MATWAPTTFSGPPLPLLPPVLPLYLHPSSFPLSWPLSLLHQGEHPLLRLLMSSVTASWGRRPGAGPQGTAQCTLAQPRLPDQLVQGEHCSGARQAVHTISTGRWRSPVQGKGSFSDLTQRLGIEGWLCP